MKVGQLIEWLKGQPEDREVLINQEGDETRPLEREHLKVLPLTALTQDGEAGVRITPDNPSVVIG